MDLRYALFAAVFAAIAIWRIQVTRGEMRRVRQGNGYVTRDEAGLQEHHGRFSIALAVALDGWLIIMALAALVVLVAMSFGWLHRPA